MTTTQVRDLSTSMMGIPAMGELGSVRATGLTTSLAPITRATSYLLHLRVDVVHLAQLVVGNVGLGQQHVHVAGHAAGDRVHAEIHVQPLDSSRFIKSRRRAGIGKPPCRTPAR
jgi:hypothetical protein